MFEYLVGNGADVEIINANLKTLLPKCEAHYAAAAAAMVQRRQEWIDQAVSLVHRWHLPLIAVRSIHDYLIGFNWRAVLCAFDNPKCSV